MVSNQKLFSVGNFDFRLQHLLVIGVLALTVSIGMMIRSGPTSYGFELFEFDPFFNLRATEFILEMELMHILIGLMKKVGIHLVEMYLKLHKLRFT